MAEAKHNPKPNRLVKIAQRIERELENAALKPDDTFRSAELQKADESERAELQRFKAAAEYLQSIRNDIDDQPDFESENGTTQSTLNDRDCQPATLDDPFATQRYPERFGRFQIKRVLGQGGFARVFLANDPDLNRLVALKIPRPTTLASDDAKIRFEREAKATALLCHPNIVPVFESGSIGPVRYIASAFCNGPTLAYWFAEQDKRIEPQLAAAIIERLAEAVEHAHQRGVIHRDLKPANVLLESEGETITASSVVDSLRISDFGLAKVRQFDDQKLTVDGAIVGTPAYMSPEQAKGSTTVDRSADIYTLGVMLFELLTGHLPFEKASSLALLHSIANDIPVPPRKSRRLVPPDLDAICMKTLSNSPANRYASAHDLADDLARWLKGMPVTARKIGSTQRSLRWARRNPIAAAATSLAVLSLLVGFSLTFWQWRNAQHNLALTRVEYDRAEKNLAAAELALDREKTQRLRAEKVAQFIGSTFRSPTPSNDGRDVKVVDVLQRSEQEISELFDDDPETQSLLLHQIGFAYSGLGMLDDAIRVLQSTRDQQIAAGIPTNSDTPSLLRHLAEAQNSKGLYDLALKNIILAENISLEEFGELHMESIDCMTVHAGILQNQGDYRATISKMKSVLEHVDQIDGFPPNIYWKLMGKWGIALLGDRQFEQASPILKDAVTNLEAFLGADHPQTLSLRNEYLNSLVKLGKTEDVINLRIEILESNKRIQGPEHPKTLIALNNLASAYSVDNQLEKAKAAYEECVAQSLITFGSENPNSSVPKQHLANILVKLEEPERALELYQEVYDVFVSKIGPRHWRSKTCLSSIADTYEKLVDWRAAAESWETLASEHTPDNPKDLIGLRSCNARAGICQIRDARVETGLEKIDEYIRFVPESGMSDKQSQSTVTRILARCVAALLSQSQFEVAEPYARKFAERATRPDAHPQPFDELLSLVYSATIQTGLKNETKVAELLEKLLGEDSDYSIKNVSSDDEAAWVRESLAILRESIAEPDSPFAHYLQNLGNFLDRPIIEQQP